MTKEVAQQETNAVATMDIDAFGAGPISGQDIVIPKILAMQGLSNYVTEGVARFGDFVDSLSGEVLGSIDKPIEFIPFFLEKMWIVSKKEGARFIFDRYEPVTVANENKPWNEVVGGVEIKNEKCYNFYCILPSDPNLPYVLAFKSTSAKAGRELATQMYVKNRAAGKVPPAKVMKLFGSKGEKEGNKYVVMKSAVVRDSTQEEVANCLTWFKTIQEGGASTDNSDVAAPDQVKEKPKF